MENDEFSFLPAGFAEEEDKAKAQKVVENISGIKLENKMENRVDSGGNDDTTRKLGSLSFTVSDISGVKKSGPRKKVPFEKGYSQMDWMRLTRTHPDLAGLNGQSNRRLVTLNEVKHHREEGSMWTVLKGRVYNISPYMKFHPGGVDMLMQAVGKDCTSLFIKYHAWVNADILLDKCLMGILDDSTK